MSIDDWDHIEMSARKIGSCWEIEILHTHAAWQEPESGFKPTEVLYFFLNTSGKISEINFLFDGNISNESGLAWLDLNKNGMLDKGDTFHIDGSGGTKGVPEPGDEFELKPWPSYGVTPETFKITMP